MFREIESCMVRSSSSSVEGSAENLLGIESYGISVTTLEEVFLRVAGSEYDVAETFMPGKSAPSLNQVISQASNDQAPKLLSHNKVCASYQKAIWIPCAIIKRAYRLIVATILCFFNFLGVQCCSCCLFSIFWQHTKALLIKRAISARRDRKTIVFQLLIPAVFLLFGLLLLKLKPHPDQQSVTFTTSHFNPLLRGGGGGGPIPFDLSWPIANEVCNTLLL